MSEIHLVNVHIILLGVAFVGLVYWLIKDIRDGDGK